MDLVQHALIFFDRALAAPRDFELAQQRRQRRAQLVRGIARESLLPLEFLVQPVEQPVERTCQKVQLVAGPRDRQPLVAIRGGHRHRRPSPSASPATEHACKAAIPRAAASSQNPTDRPARIKATFRRLISMGSDGAPVARINDGEVIRRRRAGLTVPGRSS